MKRIYDYLLLNGIPFDCDIYPDGSFLFHIFLDDLTIVDDSLDSTDYFNIRYFIKNVPLSVRKKILSDHPGNIYYKNFKEF